MIELRKIIQRNLKLIHPRVSFQSAPETTEFPYLVFEIGNINPDGEVFQQGLIDIDGWDDKNDTTVLEELMRSVDLVLDKKTFSEGKITATFFLETKTPVPSENPKLHRRKRIYQVRIFERS